jgi:hypothetical protein
MLAPVPNNAFVAGTVLINVAFGVFRVNPSEARQREVRPFPFSGRTRPSRHPAYDVGYR